MKHYACRISVPQKVLLATIVLLFTCFYFSCSWLFVDSKIVKEQTQNTNLTRCSDQWPRMDLFLPLPPTESGLRELTKFIFPSLALFWPQQHMKLALVTDGEGPETKKFTTKLQTVTKETFPNIASLSIMLNTSPFYIGRGWDRQQWLMFWADNFTQAEYVGFLDSDAVFVTRVDKYDLYNDGKPIIRALYGKPFDPSWWPTAARSTYEVTGLKALIREHIRRYLKKRTFDEAFVAIMHRSIYSQFNIMCAYLWYFERDTYYWTIGERDHFWKEPPAYGQVSSLGEANITKELFLRQQPHLALHWNYETFKDDPNAIKHVFRSGICYSLPSWSVNDSLRVKQNARLTVTHTPGFCADFPDRMNNVNPFEWTFEGYDILPFDKVRALKAHQQRLEAIDNCPHKFDEKLLDKL